jgi:hypothetical protein
MKFNKEVGIFLVIDADWNWGGIGIDWYKNIKGFTLGFIGFHIIHGIAFKTILNQAFPKPLTREDK